MLLNFQKRFVPFILAGEKTHTIRATRKTTPKAGEICHCYTGLRQKGAELLGRWRCVRVQDIEIKGSFHAYAGFIGGVIIDGAQLAQDECEQLARRDGFEDFAAMAEFWRGRLPFQGHVIHWDRNQPYGRVEHA